MFNFQWTPNPVLQISKKWSTWWEGYNLTNLIMNLKVNMSSSNKKIIDIPFTKLSNFDEKIKNIQTDNITSRTIDVLPLIELIGGDINMETATFVKAYFIYKFCNIRNGDFFRSQADNLTKFAQTILSNKVINPSNKFKLDEDKIINGNRKWIEYIYFNLYFTENPNKKVNNIKFKIVGFQEADEDETLSLIKGGSKYTRKIIKSKKYTRKNNYKRNKKTIHKYKNKKNKKTIRQRGGEPTNNNVTDPQNIELSSSNIAPQNSPVSSTLAPQNSPVSSTTALPNSLVDSTPAPPNSPVSSTPAPPNSPVNSTPAPIVGISVDPAVDEENRNQEEEDKAKQEIAKLKSENKNLIFDITNIDFSEFKDTQEIKDNIIRNKNHDDEINSRPIDANFGNIFNKFMEKYDIYLNIFNGDGEIKNSEKRNLQIWIYTYLLLACYNTAIIESIKPLTKFNNDSWWFFSADDFKIIANYLNVKQILEKFDNLIQEAPPVERGEQVREEGEKVREEGEVVREEGEQVREEGEKEGVVNLTGENI
jgi:hypothetical protein